VTGRVTHIAINADDDGATQAFYEGLFGWSFEPYYPGFVRTAVPLPDAFVVAVQQRRELVLGIRASGPDVSIQVDDLNVVLVKVGELGGRVVMERSSIPGVGDLVFLADPSQNVVGAVEYQRR